MTSKFSTLGVFVAVVFTVSAIHAAEHTKDSVKTIKKNLKEGKAVIVDVREQREWNAGHLEGAKLLPLSELQAGVDAKALAKEVPKIKIIYCHCRAGRRALTAGDIFKELGYDVRPLRQGFGELLDLGFPEAKPE